MNIKIKLENKNFIIKQLKNIDFNLLYNIGKAVVYLSSNWARYITGHLMVVDGGCSLSAKPRG